MKCLVCADESGFQPVISKKYDRPVLIVRVAFGAHYEDPHWRDNAVVIAWLYKNQVISGAIAYQVYISSATPTQHYNFAWQLIGTKVPDWLLGIMIDVEHWGGTTYAISGDHSSQVNTLYGLHAHRMGSWTAVLIYGNQGDLAAIVPHRDKRAPVVVAAYTSQLVFKNVKGAIAQQYTDGDPKWSVPTIGGIALPRVTAGVRCDHNVFDPDRFRTGAALRLFMRPSGTKPKPKPAPKPPTVKPPTKPIVLYPRGSEYATAITSKNRHGILVLNDKMQLEIHTDHKIARTL